MKKYEINPTAYQFETALLNIIYNKFTVTACIHCKYPVLNYKKCNNCGNSQQIPTGEQPPRY